MTCMLCAVLLFGAGQDGGEPKAREPRSLYQQAAGLIESGAYESATSTLEQLVEQHAETYYAEIAVLHLAECYGISNEPQRAVKLLDEWQDRLQFPSSRAAALAEKLDERAQRIRTAAASAAAGLCEKRNEFSEALHWLQEAIGSADRQQVRLIEQEIIRVALAGCLQSSVEADCQSLLAGIESRKQVAIRFSVAERLMMEERFPEAEKQLEWLATYARQLPGGRLPDWSFTVDLRRCELGVRLKQYTKVESLLKECQAKYADVERWYEFELIGARCAVARVDFPAALKTLTGVAGNGTVPSQARAKACWMRGEIYFLMEQYDPAIEAYLEASEFEVSEYTARALLQLAKCQELTLQVANAVETYKRLQAEFPASSEASQAGDRLVYLNDMP